MKRTESGSPRPEAPLVASSSDGPEGQRETRPYRLTAAGTLRKNRDPAIPHPGKVFYGGQWMLREAVERKREQGRKYAESHQEQRREYSREHRENLRDRERERSRKYRENHREQERERWVKEGRTPGTYRFQRAHGEGIPGLTMRIAAHRQYWRKQRIKAEEEQRALVPMLEELRRLTNG